MSGSRRRTAWLALALAVACGGEREPAADAARPAPVAANTRPAAELPPVRDVLLVTIDTLRADALGFAGNPRAATPALDRLAAGGRVYTAARAHNVMTLPSHANILTGRLPYQHGVRDNSGFVLPTGVPTLAELLGAAGFATAAVISAFPLDARFGLARGFELYDDRYPEGGQGSDFTPPERHGGEVVAAGLDWWRQNEGRRRFLWLHLFEPHAPYEPPAPFAERFAAEPYLGEVAAADAYLAPILEAVTADGGPTALVVVTSDHGEALGEHGETTHGLFAYEATLKVPLVVWADGLEPAVDDRPARHVDLLPTVLAAAGVETPAGLPGRSLLAASAGDEVTYFEALSASYNRGWAPLRGVVAGGHKLIALPLPELYDLAGDPGEERNLYDAERDRARRLGALLPAASAPGGGRAESSADEAAALRSLGYITGSAPLKPSYGPQDDPKRLVELDRQMHRFIDLYQRGRLAEAVELARGIVDRRPGMGVAHYYLAQALLEMGRAQEAAEVMLAAYRAGVATAPLVRQLGLTLAELGAAERAVELLSPLAGDRDPDLLNALGTVLAEAGRLAEAKSTIERVFAADPRNPGAHQGLALVALRRSDWPEAARQAELALELNPALPLAWNYLGAARYNLGRKRPAIEAWERSLALAPDNFDVLYNVGFIAAEVGDVRRARAALERFVAAAPARYADDVGKAEELLGRLPG